MFFLYRERPPPLREEPPDALELPEEKLPLLRPLEMELELRLELELLREDLDTLDDEDDWREEEDEVLTFLPDELVWRELGAYVDEDDVEERRVLGL